MSASLRFTVKHERDAVPLLHWPLPPDDAARLFERAVALFKETGLKVETGTFQAYMAVALVNDGPVTLMLDTADRERPRRG